MTTCAAHLDADRPAAFRFRAEVAADANDHDLSEFDFYVALGYWKLAVILGRLREVS